MHPQRSHRLTTRLVGLFGLSMGLLANCAGGQTGGEVDTPVCDEQFAAVGWDTATSLGFSAAEAATSLEGTVNVSPTWFPPADPERADYVTPASNTALTFGFTFTAHQAKLIHSQPFSSGADMMSTLALAENPCRDRLELSVDVTMATPGGELDESFDAKLSVFALEDAVTDASIAVEDLSGTLTITTPNNVEAKIGLRFKWGADATSPAGSLDLGTSRVQEETADYTSVPLATW